MRQYEGYASKFAAPYTDDYDAGWEFYERGGRCQECGVIISREFDRGYADARYADHFPS